MVHAAALVAVACAVGACGSEGSPASPSFRGGSVLDATSVPADGGDASYAVCPPGLDASFTDLLDRVLSTQASCGTATPFNCHSPSGASAFGIGHSLNMALADSGVDGGLDAAAIYAELVNHPAANLGCIPTADAGCPELDRVVPGDAGASLLYVKLTLRTTTDPVYGAGMPLSAPGSICPEALDAFKTWIDQGAKMN